MSLPIDKITQLAAKPRPIFSVSCSSRLFTTHRSSILSVISLASCRCKVFSRGKRFAGRQNGNEWNAQRRRRSVEEAKRASARVCGYAYNSRGISASCGQKTPRRLKNNLSLLLRPSSRAPFSSPRPLFVLLREEEEEEDHLPQFPVLPSWLAFFLFSFFFFLLPVDNHNRGFFSVSPAA